MTKFTVSAEKIGHKTCMKNSSNKGYSNYRCTFVCLGKKTCNFAKILKFAKIKGSLSSPALKAEFSLVSQMPNSLEKQNYFL